MKKILLLLSLMFFIIQSCNYLQGVKDLGNNFSLVEADKDDISIQYCFSGDCSHSGLYVVPSNVLEYNKNSNWIIAKSFDEDYKYWIVDKNFFPEKNSNIPVLLRKHIYGPLDSIQFIHSLKIKKINLELEKIEKSRL